MIFLFFREGLSLPEHLNGIFATRNTKSGCENFGRLKKAHADCKSEGDLASKPVFWNLMEAPLRWLFFCFNLTCIRGAFLRFIRSETAEIKPKTTPAIQFAAPSLKFNCWPTSLLRPSLGLSSDGHRYDWYRHSIRTKGWTMYRNRCCSRSVVGIANGIDLLFRRHENCAMKVAHSSNDPTT